MTCHAPGRSPGYSPLLAGKDTEAESVFRPENLLREARRQKRLPEANVPEVCLLDPDGDIVRDLRISGARSSATWPCYHTELLLFAEAGGTFGVVPFAVGAPFAVLIAEELFAAGCRFLVSITSAGQIIPSGPTPCFVLIERALRDEGTSHHYLPPSAFAAAPSHLLDLLPAAPPGLDQPVHRGPSWTTDAPFRETEAAIACAREAGALAVEMEAAALYAFARARRRDVLCFAHVTNQMAQSAGDFEKGEANGARAALALFLSVARAWRDRTSKDSPDAS